MLLRATDATQSKDETVIIKIASEDILRLWRILTRVY
jgi:hypothetical protein